MYIDVGFIVGFVDGEKRDFFFNNLLILNLCN